MLKLELLWAALLLLFLPLLLGFESAPAVQFAIAQPHSPPPDDGASLNLSNRARQQLQVCSSAPDAAEEPPRSGRGDHSQLVTQIRIRRPFDGSVNTPPLHFSCAFVVDDSDAFFNKHSDHLLCVEVDRKWRRCSPVQLTPPIFRALPAGNHSAVAFLATESAERSGDNAIERLLESEPVRFTVLLRQEYREYVERQMQEERGLLGLTEDEDLLPWAISQWRPVKQRLQGVIPAVGVINLTDHAHLRFLNYPFGSTIPPPVLVIGVKTSVLHGFSSRLAIRSTWVEYAKFHFLNVKVYFIGCQPLTFGDHDPEEFMRAIELEKQRFGDLLTDELECEDSYFTLPAKVKEFLHFAVKKHPEAPYVMIADDDIYLRVNQLTQALRQHGSRTKFYAGQVWAEQFLSPMLPIRDPGHKNYLPESQYPMNTLPPFAFGPHYIMSMDCAAFIAENRHELGDLSSVDDVSVALWLLAIQVHPEHIPSFQNLRDTTCSEGVVSFADLTPHAIRVIHANLQNGAPFCRGFDIATWQKADRAALTEDKTSAVIYKVAVSLKINLSSESLEVLTEVTLEDGVGGYKLFVFTPSRDSFAAHCGTILNYLRRNQAPELVYDAIPTQVSTVMAKTINQLVEDRKVSSARVELWRHSLQFPARTIGGTLRVITVVYSRKALYSKELLECLFAAIYTQNPVRVVDEVMFRSQQQQRGDPDAKGPDVVVFSILDGGINCSSSWALSCQQAAAQLVQQYGSTSALIMIAGEAWDVDGLDERVLLMSTVSQVARKKHMYIPMASMAFGERVNLSPMLLLGSHTARRSALSVVDQHQQAPRRFCVYLYARCDRPQREYMFDLLDAMEPVDALGVCQGASRKQIQKRWRSRLSLSAFDDAVKINADYKFVIAFENAQRPGYVTEKIVNAFLAGSIPIYLGHSDTVSQLFNPRSFIDCGRFATLRACALRVMEVHASSELYESMLREPVVGNVTLFYELFSWHPDVPSSFLADQLAALL